MAAPKQPIIDMMIFGGSIYTFYYLCKCTSQPEPSKKVITSTTTNNHAYERLADALADGTSRDAQERVCTVDQHNKPTPTGNLRSEMRLHNLWHRATYMLIRHELLEADEQESDAVVFYGAATLMTKILVQRRSKLKDYCPGKLDPFPGGVVGFGESYEENALRELKEEMGIDALLLSDEHKIQSRIDYLNRMHGDGTHDPRNATIQQLFTFPYQDERVKVWGDCFEVLYHGTLDKITLQEEEVDEVLSMTLMEVKQHMALRPEDWMPDAVHAMQLYLQYSHDKRVLRRSSTSLSQDAYRLRSSPQVIFFDCDDCLYFDGWRVANQITSKIDEWCTRLGLPSGEAYELYKRHGTALKGLLNEGYIEHNDKEIDEYLQAVHNVDYSTIHKDHRLRDMLQQIDPSIQKYIFTASVREHAERCLDALGVQDLFVDIIDTKACNLETKHSAQAFHAAMKYAGVKDPESCLFLDDSVRNIAEAHKVGWRSILVGRVSRDCGTISSSEHAEHEINVIHDLPRVFPEIFIMPNEN